MLIAILGDLHLGARNSSYHFSDYFNRFFNEVFYPYCQKRGIKNVIQLGDTFDSRAALSYKAYHRCRETWFGNLEKHDIQMYMLVGNHDICYRHTLEINSPDLLLGEYKNITVINKPTQIDINGTKIDIVPWLCDENEADITTFMSRKDKGDICCGHFELSGFPHSKNDKQDIDFTKHNAILKKYGIDENISCEQEYNDMIQKIRLLKLSTKKPI